MGKRTATSDINHDNWDAPYETEEAGNFKTASQESLGKRTIKTAKRRIKPSGNNETGKSIFASFTGLKPPAPTLNSATSSTGKTFGFLKDVTTTSSIIPTTNGTTLTTTATKIGETPQQKYLSNLQQLNRSVSDWIKTHVDSNPVCILTPVFKDYEKHLKQIQDERDVGEKSALSAPSSLSSFSFVSSSTSDNKFIIDVPTTALENSKKTFTGSTSPLNINKPSSSLFSLTKDTGKSPLLQGSETTKSTPASIFGSFKTESTGPSLLTKPDRASLMVNPFTSTLKKEENLERPISFSNGSATTSSENKEVEEDEQSEEPPKVEFTPVQEDNAVFSTRCKVFVKKENNFKERGLGTLFIKKVGEDKYQLLVRAETVLGNILVNVLLSSGIPSQRMGKNNVMLVCLPTPQDPPPPTTVLLRVKTEAEADDLLQTIDKYKQS